MTLILSLAEKKDNSFRNGNKIPSLCVYIFLASFSQLFLRLIFFPRTQQHLFSALILCVDSFSFRQQQKIVTLCRYFPVLSFFLNNKKNDFPSNFPMIMIV